MRYRVFGSSGLRVSELCLGTATFGTAWGWGSEPAESKAVFNAFVEAGGTFFDCADVYQGGQSEQVLGELIAPHRDELVVATKYSGGWQGGITRSGNNRKHMVQSLEASLRRLGTDRVDLYLLHAPDLITPVEEIMRGLDDLVRAGKVLYVGFSNFPAWTVAQAATLADLRGWAPLVNVQLEYSLLERTPERELLPMADALGLAVTSWSPLGGGLLSGKYRTGEQGRQQHGGGPVQQQNTRAETILDAVLAVAAATGATPAQVALAWVRAQPARPLPILGARTLTQLQDNLASLDLTLDDEHLRTLDAATAIDLGFPQAMISNEQARQMVNGGQAHLLDHR